MKVKSILFAVVLSAFSLGANAQGVVMKLGYTNVEYILSQMPEAKQVDSELKAYETQLQNQLQSKGTELQNKVQEYQQGAATMTEIIRADREAELQSLNQRFEAFQREAQQSMQTKQAELFAPLFTKVGEAVKAVRTENGFDIIFSTGGAGGEVLLDADEKYDISDLVFKKLGITPPAKLN